MTLRLILLAIALCSLPIRGESMDTLNLDIGETFVLRLYVRSESGVINDALLFRSTEGAAIYAPEPNQENGEHAFKELTTQSFDRLWSRLQAIKSLQNFTEDSRDGIWYTAHVSIEATNSVKAANGAPPYQTFAVYKVPMEQIPPELLHWLKDAFGAGYSSQNGR
jgi:hypothetical protein